MEQIKVDIQKLELQDGDMLLVKCEDKYPPHKLARLLNIIKGQAKVALGKDVIVIIAPGMDIQKVDERIMNVQGWYRMGAEDAPCPITEAELKERLQRALQQQKTVDTPETEA